MLYKNLDHFRLSLALLDPDEIMIGTGITRHSYLELNKTIPCLKHIFIYKQTYKACLTIPFKHSCHLS